MKKKFIYCDCHYGAGNYEYPDEPIYNEDTIFLGDNWEFKNISKKYVPTQLDNLLRHLEKAEKAKAVTVAGNHECRYGALIKIYDYIEDNVLYTHGHRVVYSDKKAKKWETRKGGLRWFMLMLMRIKRHSYSPSKVKRPSHELQKKLSDYGRRKGCSTIVVGHFHYKWDGMYNGIRIIICGRGRNEIRL